MQSLSRARVPDLATNDTTDMNSYHGMRAVTRLSIGPRFAPLDSTVVMMMLLMTSTAFARNSAECRWQPAQDVCSTLQPYRNDNQSYLQALTRPVCTMQVARPGSLDSAAPQHAACVPAIKADSRICARVFWYMNIHI